MFDHWFLLCCLNFYSIVNDCNIHVWINIWSACDVLYGWKSLYLLFYSRGDTSITYWTYEEHNLFFGDEIFLMINWLIHLLMKRKFIMVARKQMNEISIRDKKRTNQYKHSRRGALKAITNGYCISHNRKQWLMVCHDCVCRAYKTTTKNCASALSKSQLLSTLFNFNSHKSILTPLRTWLNWHLLIH